MKKGGKNETYYEWVMGQTLVPAGPVAWAIAEWTVTSEFYRSHGRLLESYSKNQKANCHGTEEFDSDELTCGQYIQSNSKTSYTNLISP